MGEKKKKAATVKIWYKVLAVLACVVIAAMMILSGMGHNWITALRTIKPGDTVTVQITINGPSGTPLVTSDEELYQKQMAANQGLFYAKDLVIAANQSAPDSLVAIPVYSTGNGWSDTFALFSNEYEAISQALVGMKVNEQKTITLPSAGEMTETWSSAQLANEGVNLTDIHVGDQLSIAVAGKATLEKNATASSYSVRIGEVTAKSAEGVTIKFGYPTIDIKVLQIATT